MKDILNKAIKIIAFTLCAAVVFSFISAFCERKTYTGAWNYMSKLNEFYSQKEDTLDYICVGSSHMYCTVNPLEVWNESGAAGFVLATQQQPLRASYHYIKEAFKTQSPKYVVLEGFMIGGGTAYDPAVLYDAIDPLKPSLNKMQMINSLVEHDSRPDYYFNVLKYHTRWNTLAADQTNQLFVDHIDTYKGFVALSGSFEGKNVIPDYDSTKDVELSEFNTDVLNDIYELITDNGAEMILMLGPYDAESSPLCELVKAEIKWARDKGVTVLDYAEKLYELSVDPECDYYDAGHLDISGAKKISADFAEFLTENGVEKNTLIDEEKWQSDYDNYKGKFPSEFEE